MKSKIISPKMYDLVVINYPRGTMPPIMYEKQCRDMISDLKNFCSTPDNLFVWVGDNPDISILPLDQMIKLRDFLNNIIEKQQGLLSNNQCVTICTQTHLKVN